jgi:hypothetical protein
MTGKFIGHFSSIAVSKENEYRHIIENIQKKFNLNNIELTITDFINKNKIDYLNDYKDLRKRIAVILEYIYLPLKLHEKSNLNVLDIGSGFCCIKMISDVLCHNCINIEKPCRVKNSDLFLFNQINTMLNCTTFYENIVYTTKLKNNFDVGFILSQTFDEIGDNKLWNSNQWVYFLRNLKSCLAKNGKIVLLYNSKTFNAQLNVLAEENLKILKQRAEEFSLYIV